MENNVLLSKTEREIINLNNLINLSNINYGFTIINNKKSDDIFLEVDALEGDIINGKYKYKLNIVKIL